jgi:hypothetical protein
MHRVLAFTALFALSAHTALRPTAANAQDDTTRISVDTTRTGADWNSSRVRSLIARATARRAEPQADTALHNYRATAEGFVYFFLDRQVSEERTLVRVNQIGLELYCRQPGDARQRIAGMRDASPLPNTMRYHIDHLTMVQNGFGDVIRMGDGDEVRAVPHPASAGAADIYDYRLADSLEIRLPSMPEPIRVYEVQVRPRRTDQPGFVGSIFVDRATADIIRMTFTFTPASYVDRRLDYINLSLDNALWEGRYWLPNEQTVEIRRQLPELDFVAGSVIRGRMRILNYDFNVDIPDSIFQNPRPVGAASPDALKSYEFDSGLYDDLSAAGLEQPPEIAKLREEAAGLIGRRLMSGLPSLRLFFPDVSSAIRYDRAEGLFLGGGLTYSAGPPWRTDVAFGYATANRRGSMWLRTSHDGAASRISATAYAHQLRDIGPVTATAGVVNSLAAVFLGRDYTDPWYATGASLSVTRDAFSNMQFDVTATAERQRLARLEVEHAPFDDDDAFRAVRPIDNGSDYSVTAALSRALPSAGVFAWGGSLSVRGAMFTPAKIVVYAPGVVDSDAAVRSSADVRSRSADAYLRPMLRLQARLRPASHEREFNGSLTATTATVNAPLQQYMLLGGIGTLPGYPFRSFVGRTGFVARAQLTQRVAYPWIGVRALAAAGATTRPDRAVAKWYDISTTDGIRTSAGAGLSLFWDLLHVDAVKGLNGGDWALQLSFTRLLDDIS